MNKSVFFRSQINCTFTFLLKKSQSKTEFSRVRMNKKRKSFFSIFLILIFLFPSFVKLGHHHEHFVCSAKHEKHLHQHHEDCAVCEFHFSLFETSDHQPIFINDSPADTYRSSYKSRKYTTVSEYTFLLRAPPVV